MPRMRSTKTGAAGSTESATPSASSKYILPSETGPPPKLLILPKRATSEARVVTLPHPRHGRPARYLVCPETGIYEFIKIAAPKSAPRSWLVDTPVAGKTQDGAAERKAQVVMHADLYMATTIDPLFLVLPALSASKASKGSDEKKVLFLSSDDHLEKLPEESSHLSEIIGWNKTRALIESRMAAICDTVEVGDESMFRLSQAKLLEAVLDKAEKMSDRGLPPSMEDKFVKRALEAPILLQKRDVKASESQPPNESAKSQESTPRAESTNSQVTAVTAGASVPSASQASTAATPLTEEDLATDAVVNTVEASPDIVKLQRLRVALDFICSSYISPTVTEQVQLLLKGSKSVDFCSLDEHLAKVAELRAEAVSLRSISDFSQKHSRDEEDDQARAEKKRKLEEEKKRKANESRGVRELKKVNTSGMKKLSEFFKAK